ncbi:hypothetical protein [Deinococcus lacus]
MVDVSGSGNWRDVSGEKVELNRVSKVVINAKGDTVWIRAE